MALARSKKIMAAARGQECTLRLVGVCNFNPDTTIAAHIGRRRGMALKCGDNFVVFSCSSCHSEIDSSSRASYADDKLRSLEETQELLINEGLLVVK